MSYILDALKKADQQRQHAQPPTLRTAPQIVPEQKKSPAWRYAALGIVLVVVATLAGWLQSRTPAQHEKAPRDTDATTLAAARTPTPQRAPAPVPTLPAPELPLPEAGPHAPATRAFARPQRPAVLPAQTPEATAAQAPQARVLAMDELPLPVRQALPALTVSLHAWSATPRSRLVSINNQLMHEGDSPAAGVTLEEITPDGMILSFHGYRFRHGVR